MFLLIERGGGMIEAMSFAATTIG